MTKNGNQTAQGYIKCNIDAAIFQDIHAFGIGICIRGGQGNLIQAENRLFDEREFLISMQCFPF